MTWEEAIRRVKNPLLGTYRKDRNWNGMSDYDRVIDDLKQKVMKFTLI